MIDAGALVADDGRRINRRAYWDPEVHALELERIFRRSWLFLAHETELREPGDYVTRRMGLEQCIVLRDRQGEVQVFLNSCTHRGSQLCRGDKGNTSSFTCSYHGWKFALTGDLLGVPEQREVFGPDLDKSKLGLISPPHVATSHGLIFASWDQDAPPLHDYLANIGWYLHAVLGKTDYEVVGHPIRSLLHTNWKIGSENIGGDTWHVSTAHKSVLRFAIFDDGRSTGGVADRAGFATWGGNGHITSIQQFPPGTRPKGYNGYPEDLWAEFDGRLDEGQKSIQQDLTTQHGNVFPNLSFLEGVNLPRPDLPREVCRVHLRVWQPIAPDLSEVWSWCLVPAGVDDDWKHWSQVAFLRSLAPGGMNEVDDFQNMKGAADMNAGGVAWGLDNIYMGGQQLHPDEGIDWPGTVFRADHTEIGMPHFYRQWQRLMAMERR